MSGNTTLIAPAQPSVIPASIVTPGLLSFILVNKFCDHLPFYRQETRFKRLGIHISRQDMSNWTIGAARRLSPLIELFRQEIRGGPLIQMDETPVQVLDEPGRPNTRKSYMLSMRMSFSVATGTTCRPMGMRCMTGWLERKPAWQGCWLHPFAMAEVHSVPGSTRADA
jgi:transposase IS66 family protein